jgi:PAS domain S-box-containing protein
MSPRSARLSSGGGVEAARNPDAGPGADPGPDTDLAELRSRLQEAEETLDAIRNGDVDAVVVGGPAGQQVYTLENADRPYRVLIEQMQEGAITLSDDGTVLYCNQRFATIVARPRETIIGESILRFFDAAEAAAFRRLLARGPDAGAPGEFTLQGLAGIRVPVNVSLVDLKVEIGAHRVVCGVVTDLTHNRRRSHELAAANERLATEIEERRRAEDSLHLALDAAGMGSWDLDLVNETSRCSVRHDQIFGHPTSRTDWSVRDFLAQTLPDDHALVARAFAEAVASGSIEFEARIRRADNDAIRWIAMKGQTFYEAGIAVRLAGVVSDVTERREVEEQLRQAQKMEAVGQLTGGVAHDFNNLLMVIGGSLEVLRRLYPVDEKAGRFLDAAQRAVARGGKLNQQLLTFSRRQDLRVEAVLVNELIPGFEHLLDRALGETVKVEIASAVELWHCQTDPHQLETAILNLAINARDAMPQGGALMLATVNRSIGEQAASRWGAKAGDYVVVSVADTGSGMTPEVLSRVFEPFFTTKEIGKGTGLGLSQVYGFARQSGGFVNIESQPGSGTTVFIHLPRIAPARIEAVGVASPLQESSGRGVILVVEDDADVRLTTCSMLRELGYSVREAESGPAALRTLAADHSIDLVFSDVIMPDGMSGIDLARELKARRPSLPMLLTSGYTAQRIIPEALANGLAVLRKPFSMPELGQSILEALSQAHAPRRGR